MPSRPSQAIQSAQIHYNEQGTPVSDLFGDVYFSNESGLEETQYVFLQQNGLPERWFQHKAASFHIIETGFGTGLNFLLAWHHFELALTAAPQMKCQRLYFTSFEKYPIAHKDLTLALAQWPTLAPLAEQLLAQYPISIPGCHRLQLADGRVTLDLWLGDVHDSMPQLPIQNQADAWFLDGFAPSKNPQMWQPELFSQMARLSKVGTSVATFTSAGLVRRGLAEVGFQVKKIKGYGRKREMCVGTFGFSQTQDPAPRLIDSSEPVPGALDALCNSKAEDIPSSSMLSAAPPFDICIVGGGLASICLALALLKRGRSVQLLCKDQQIAHGASHNRQGALYPQLQASFTAVSAFHSHAFLFARRFFQRMHLQHFAYPHDFCGVLTLACTEQLAQRQQKISLQQVFTDGLLQSVTAQQASELAGLPLHYSGLFFPQGGWIAPQMFCQSALDYLKQQAHFSVHFDCTFAEASYDHHRKTWQLSTSLGEMQCKELCLANGAAMPELQLASDLPLNRVRGQVSHVQCDGMAALKTVLCHQGYITPAQQLFSSEPEHCVGATFDRDRQQPIELEADNQANLALVNKVLQQPAWFADAKVSSAKAGVRATLPDHLPLAGQQLNQTWILGGLGARGLLFAPILAEHLAASLCAEPSPLSMDFAALVTPQRFHKTRA
jgi:tRNA 5-methylaminomethyl-2-thiouridine biosynthesis bifunctional protein